MANVWLFVFYANGLFFVAIAQSLASTYKDEQCIAKLDSCSLKLGDKPLRDYCVQGPKGEKGDRGLMGVRGDPGLPGPRGYSGISGIPGEKGDMGFPGEKGDRGSDGPTGGKGDRGAVGPQGDRGQIGDKGDPGGRGLSGLQGPPGAPGIPGSCPCTMPKRAEHMKDSGGKESVDIATTVCKDIAGVKTGERLMGHGPMTVTCVVEGHVIWTCVPPKERKVVSGAKETEPFWLSSKGVTLPDIYNLSYSQLEWLQVQSTSLKQKLRYHCKKSAPYDPADEDHSLLMLSWNDITFGPVPRESTPFVYNVPSETDGCMNPSKAGARTSDIVISYQSISVQRLPVVDFLVRDLRDNLEDIGVEHLELCFS